MSRVSELVIAKGFTRDQFIHCIDEYALLDVSHRTQDRAYRLLTISRRFGKLPTTAPDLYSLRQVTRKILWTWVTRTTLSRDKSSPQASGKICRHARNHRMTKARLKTKSVDVRVREICLDALKERGVLDFDNTMEGPHCRTCSTFPEYKFKGFSRNRLVFVAHTTSIICLSNPSSIREVLLRILPWASSTPAQYMPIFCREIMHVLSGILKPPHSHSWVHFRPEPSLSTCLVNRTLHIRALFYSSRNSPCVSSLHKLLRFPSSDTVFSPTKKKVLQE